MIKNNNPNLYKTRNILIVMASIGILCLFFVFSIYALFFRNKEIVAEAENWGQFGDFIGGVLNPIFGLIAVVGLLWTIYQNQRELHLTREELSKSSEALNMNNEIALKRERQQEIKEKKD